MEDKQLQTCDIQVKDFKIEPFALVIFGGAGDLSKRKLVPALFDLYLENELPKQFSIVGFGLPDMSEDNYRAAMKGAISAHSDTPPDRDQLIKFSKHLHYVPSFFDDNKNYKILIDKLSDLVTFTDKGTKDVIYYMAAPPQFLPLIVEKLEKHNLAKGVFNAKIIVEKPFGSDYLTAARLNQILAAAFKEDQIYRINHYLSRETVQNILFFRFSNSIFEPIWNHRYIDNVQITVAESVGIEHRGTFYEQAGVVRDIVQNYVMQLVGLVALEPPVGFDADYIRDEKIKVFRSICAMGLSYVDDFTVRGQYGPGTVNGAEVPGYRSEKNVASDSNTPTFMAAKMYIDNWRWANVPFYVRSGKRMAKCITQICIQFKQPPLSLFGKAHNQLKSNILILNTQPQEEISLQFGVKYPNSHNKIYPVDMKFDYQKAFNIKSHPVYEQLLVNVMKGDLSLFLRQDAVEAMWQVVDPIISRWRNTAAPEFPNYEAGTWGPKEAQRLLEQDGRSWVLH